MLPMTFRGRQPLETLQIGMTAVAGHGGGVDRYYFNLLRELPHSGVNVRGLVVGDPASVPGSIATVSSFANADEGMLRRWMGMRRIGPPLVAKADLVVSHFAAYAFPILDTLRSKPLVVQFHGPWALESRAEGVGRVQVLLRELIERAVHARADRFIVLSQAFANILIERYKVRENRIRIVPGGVDLRRFRVAGSRADARTRLGWPTDRRIVTTVRRLVPSKGIENLIDAVVAIRERHDDVLVKIVGTGPLHADLQRRIEERGLNRHVQLAGHVPEADLPDVYRAADLFVVPTIALEGFGLVVIEALACGTPALVTPVGGLPEVVRDLDPSMILSGAAARDVAAGIAAFLDGTQKLPDAESCIAYARRFDWPKVAESVEKVYREVAP